jgi:alpha-methylacyl-CoA racemase
MDRTQWEPMKERVAAIFKAKTRDEWCQLMEGTDVCFAPVLSITEAPQHPHNVQRKTFVEVEGVVQPAPAPRFSATPVSIQRPPSHAGQHTDEVLVEWGLDADRVAKLRDAGAIA